jgi:hypothetical protein
MHTAVNGAIHENSKDFFKMNKNEMIQVMETKTAQVPSHIYLGLAAGAIAHCLQECLWCLDGKTSQIL